MKPWSRSILRLSGRGPEPAPERKSDEQPQSVFRRFFATLARMDRRARIEAKQEPEERA